jgi:hypothetical protein
MATEALKPRGALWYGEPDAISNAIGCAKFRSRSHDTVIRVYDSAGNVTDTHEHVGDFKEWAICTSDTTMAAAGAVLARRAAATVVQAGNNWTIIQRRSGSPWECLTKSLLVMSSPVMFEFRNLSCLRHTKFAVFREPEAPPV